MSFIFLKTFKDFKDPWGPCNVFNFLMYADDTTLYCCLEDIDQVNKQAVVNQELHKIHNWIKYANGLKLNKYMIFNKPK